MRRNICPMSQMTIATDREKLSAKKHEKLVKKHAQFYCIKFYDLNFVPCTCVVKCFNLKANWSQKV